MGERIIDYPEAETLANDDYVLLDGNTEGSRRVLAKNLGQGKPQAMIAATGAQYIELPLYSDDSFIIKTKLLMQNIDITGPIIGDIWDISSFCVYCEENLLFRKDTGNPIIITNFKPWEAVDIELNYNTGRFIYDGVSYGGDTPRNSYHRTVKLFGCLQIQQRFSNVAMGEIQVFRNNNLIMDLVPKKSVNTGAGYYHDTIENQDYYSLTETPLKYFNL